MKSKLFLLLLATLVFTSCMEERTGEWELFEVWDGKDPVHGFQYLEKKTGIPAGHTGIDSLSSDRDNVYFSIQDSTNVTIVASKMDTVTEKLRGGGFIELQLKDHNGKLTRTIPSRSGEYFINVVWVPGDDILFSGKLPPGVYKTERPPFGSWPQEVKMTASGKEYKLSVK